MFSSSAQYKACSVAVQSVQKHMHIFLLLSIVVETVLSRSTAVHLVVQYTSTTQNSPRAQPLPAGAAAALLATHGDQKLPESQTQSRYGRQNGLARDGTVRTHGLTDSSEPCSSGWAVGR